MGRGQVAAPRVPEASPVPGRGQATKCLLHFNQSQVVLKSRQKMLPPSGVPLFRSSQTNGAVERCIKQSEKGGQEEEKGKLFIVMPLIFG